MYQFFIVKCAPIEWCEHCLQAVTAEVESRSDEERSFAEQYIRLCDDKVMAARKESCSIMNWNEWWQFFKSHLAHNENRTMGPEDADDDDNGSDAVSQEKCVNLNLFLFGCSLFLGVYNETWWIYLYAQTIFFVVFHLLCGFFVWYLLLLLVVAHARPIELGHTSPNHRWIGMAHEFITCHLFK